ncbi:MAG: hypothetical protein GWN71_16985, partial [Gammaproteobacteria bacterium]|nr:hypothetical protein [Gemmatimonadota bacterium]NIU75209.1 hypothetical protein [Gammaproteobacteria bacterium]
RARLARLHRQARRQALNALSGDGEAALNIAREWVELEPLDDEAQHQFIRLLAEAGHRSEALRQYERYAERIRAELEVEPLEETITLVERIRGGAPDTVARGDTTPEDATPTAEAATPTPATPSTAARVAGPHERHERSDERRPAPDTARRRGLAWAAAAAL